MIDRYLRIPNGGYIFWSKGYSDLAKNLYDPQSNIGRLYRLLFSILAKRGLPEQLRGYDEYVHTASAAGYLSPSECWRKLITIVAEPSSYVVIKRALGHGARTRVSNEFNVLSMFGQRRIPRYGTMLLEGSTIEALRLKYYDSSHKRVRPGISEVLAELASVQQSFGIEQLYYSKSESFRDCERIHEIYKNKISPVWKNIIDLTRNYLLDLSSFGPIKVSIAHRDLAPWNFIKHKSEGVIIDWEYGATQRPLTHDIVGYIVSELVYVFDAPAVYALLEQKLTLYGISDIYAVMYFYETALQYIDYFFVGRDAEECTILRFCQFYLEKKLSIGYEN